MRAWLERLDARQRLLVFAGGGLSLLLLLWGLLVQPLADRIDRLERTLASQQETLRWMQQAALEIQRLRRRGGVAGDLGGRSLLAVVDQSARAAGLGDGIRRVEPEGEARVRVRLQHVSFDRLVRWLAGLRGRYGVRVAGVQLERAPEPGRVDVRLTLER